MKKVGILLFVFIIIFLYLMFSSSFVSADSPIIKVKFEILYGDGKTDLYSGGWFYYNITLTNGASSELNATYTVTVYNPDWSINGNTRNFNLNLKPNETGILYPNNTLFSPNDVDAHVADTVGTYRINITSNIIGATFYRFQSENSYTWLPNSCQITIDAMPSYQEKLNNQTSQFYQQNQQYFQNYQKYLDQFQQYSQEARIEATKAQNLSGLTIVIGTMALVTSYLAIPKTQRKDKMTIIILIGYGVIFAILAIVLLT